MSRHVITIMGCASSSFAWFLKTVIIYENNIYLYTEKILFSDVNWIFPTINIETSFFFSFSFRFTVLLVILIWIYMCFVWVCMTLFMVIEYVWLLDQIINGFIGYVLIDGIYIMEWNRAE
jgi:hypothetical protein